MIYKKLIPHLRRYFNDKMFFFATLKWLNTPPIGVAPKLFRKFFYEDGFLFAHRGFWQMNFRFRFAKTFEYMSKRCRFFGSFIKKRAFQNTNRVASLN